MTTTDDSKQLKNWRGRFGDSYAERNHVTVERVRTYIHAFAKIWERMSAAPPKSVLECGCNVGLALRAIRAISDASLSAIEPNPKARAMAMASNVAAKENLKDGSVQHIPFEDESHDLVFTSGVLIHVAPEHLGPAMDEMARVSRRYILMIEYYSREISEIPYRGQEKMLWKADYGRLFLERHPDWEAVEAGFFWQPLTGFDDSTWWLFRRQIGTHS